MRFDLVERHLPIAYKMLIDSAELVKLASNYDKAVSSVRKSFCSSVIAAKASNLISEC